MSMGATWKIDCRDRALQACRRRSERTLSPGTDTVKVAWVILFAGLVSVAVGDSSPGTIQGDKSTTTEEAKAVILPLEVLPQIGHPEGSDPTLPTGGSTYYPPLPPTTPPPPPLLQGPEIIFPPENLTVPIGSDVTLKCTARDLSDPDRRVTITWFKDGDHRIQQSLPPRIRFHQGKKKLKIDNVQWSDRGRYECTAHNLYGLVRSPPGTLNVERPVSIVRGVMNRTVARGTPVNSSCAVEGFPEPEIFWEVNNLLYYDEPGTNRPYGRQYFVYSAQRTISLTCKAMNNVSTVGVTRRKSSGVIFVTNPLSYCKGYNGYNCAPYGLGDVFVNGSMDNPGGSLERLISGYVSSMVELGVPAPCRTALSSLLCHSAFPACDRADPDHLKPVAVCSEDCLAVRELVCQEHWESLRSVNSGILQIFPAFPNCSTAPFTARDDDTCARTAYFDTSPSYKKTVNCIIQNGHTYVGRQNITENGSYCQSWNQEYYKDLGYTDVAFAELEDAHNYCRNPGGLDVRPWCFVRKRTRVKQYCSIPSCDVFQGSMTSPMTGDQPRVGPGGIPPRQGATPNPRYVIPPGSLGEGHPVDMSGFVFIILSGLLILLILILVIGLSIRRVRYLRRHPPYIFPRGFNIRWVPENPMFGKNFDRSFDPRLEHLEYPRNEIVYDADIGEGAFGRVFKATVVDPSAADGKILVAVKMLKSSASRGVTEDFDREAVLMSGFSNVNVIKLWGVCFVGRPLCLLLEYMERGDLQEYLQAKNPRNPQFFDRDESETGIPGRLLVSFARQVANGMVYLSDRRLVHRDVATRNCLVNSIFQVKIADFGLARYLAPDRDHHIGSRDERVPVRWTAPEALWNYQFTTSSDVWSYGVLVWELFGYAEQPYVRMTLEEVFLETQRGYQLPCPENTPSALYGVMTACWRLDPPSRPTFQTLNSQLTELETEFQRAGRLSSMGGQASVERL